MQSDLSTTDRVEFTSVPRSVLTLAAKIRKIHGDVLISTGGNGIHLNFASPVCLEQDGDIELNKKHLALNAERYLTIGQWSRKRGTYNNDLSALCLKTSKPYRVTELLQMKSLEKRGYNRTGSGTITEAASAKLVEDGRGNMIPDHPGEVIPLSQLPEGHPALDYVHSRGFNPTMLEFQFRCGFCEKEAPEGEDYGRFYRRMPDLWKDTPQGRIIFYCDIKGVQVGWQARLLDRVRGMKKESFHPYRRRWEPTHELTLSGESSKWTLIESLQPETLAFSNRKREWTPAKYKTAFGAKRNKLLMGYDAAVIWNKGTGLPEKDWRCLLVEGPLDAARLEAPAIAVLGKYFSREQGALIAERFKKVGVVRDRDDAGGKLLNYVEKVLQGSVELESFDPPVEEGQDPGDMSPEVARQFSSECLEALK